MEQTLVFDAPAALGAARRLARRWHGIWPEVGVAKLQRVHSELAAGVHKGFGRVYQFVRPRMLWRIARRDMLPQLDMTRTSHITVAGASGITIAWRLAKKYPTLTVTSSMVPPPIVTPRSRADDAHQVAVLN